MKNKTLLKAISAVALLCGVASCNHEHTFATEWSKDATNHWHAANCDHTTELSDLAAHSWNDGTVTKVATEEVAGEKTFKCTVCGYEKVETIAKLDHTHKFAEEWSKNETDHWHASTCGHASEVKDKAAHSWDEGEVTTQPTYSAVGVKTFTCSVCEQEKTEDVAKLETKLLSDFDSLEVIAKGSLTSVLDLGGGYTFNPGEKTDSEVATADTPIEVDGLSFTNYLKTGGKTDKGSRVIDFEVTGAGTVSIYAKTGTTDDFTRKISVVEVAKGYAHDTVAIDSNTAKKFELEFHRAGAYQLQFSANVSIYRIETVWEDGVNDAEWIPAESFSNPNMFNASEMFTRTIEKDTTIGRFTINAGTEADNQHVVIDSSSKKYAGVTYDNRLKLTNQGNGDYRSISFTVTEKTKVTVIGLSGNASDNRKGALSKASDNTVVGEYVFAGTKDEDTKKLDAGVFTVEAGSYYFHSVEVDKSVNVWAILLESLPTEMTVAEALSAADNTLVTISGEVTAVDAESKDVTIKQGESSIVVQKVNETVAIGDTLEATGRLATVETVKVVAEGADVEVTPAVPNLDPVEHVLGADAFAVKADTVERTFGIFTMTTNVKGESIKYAGGVTYPTDSLSFTSKQISLTSGKVTTTTNGISFEVGEGKTATVVVYASQKHDKNVKLSVLDAEGEAASMTNLKLNGTSVSEFAILVKGADADAAVVVDKYEFTLGAGTYHLGGSGGGAYIYGLTVTIAPVPAA